MAGPSKGIRLSFLALADQNKYEMVFSQATNGNFLSAEASRDVLSRSNIGDDNLAKIWDLSNITKEPRLTFPEFAVAMYLTAMKMNGSDIPSFLPDEIKNEIMGAIRLVLDNGLQQGGSLVQQQQATGMPSIQQSQMTGMPSYGSSSNFSSQNIGTNVQAPMMTGVTPMMNHGGPQVAMPTGMLSNNMIFSNGMMPGSSFKYNSTLSKNVKIPWAVTEEEKKQYTKLFKAWDTDAKGTLSGETAQKILSQSGLPRNVLEQIWNLSDLHNRGKLNINEFAVAMHLVYRKLNGYNVPETLPDELIPTSARDLNDSVNFMKTQILNGIAQKRHLNNFSSSPSTPTTSSSPQISRSLTQSPRNATTTKKEKEEEEEEKGYVSSARRMGPDRARNRSLTADSTSYSSPTTPNSSYGYRGKQSRVFDLKKEIDQNKKRLAQLQEDAAHKVATPYTQLSALDKRDIDDLKDRIRELQKEISKNGNEHGEDMWGVYINKSNEFSSLAKTVEALEEEIKYALKETLAGLLDQVDETENDLKEKKIQAINKKTSAAASSRSSNSGSSSDIPLNIVGTGPNGEVTESDRIKAKAKAMVAARMGKITGKTSPANTSDITTKKEIESVDQEREEFKLYTESIAESVREMEQKLKAIHKDISMIGLDINKQVQDQRKIEERGRLEHGEGVAMDLKDFISQLKYDAALAKAPDVDPDFESKFPSF